MRLKAKALYLFAAMAIVGQAHADPAVDAKRLAADLSRRQASLNALAQSPADSIAVVIIRDLPGGVACDSDDGKCGPPAILVPRVVLIRALQAKIAEDKAKLTVLGGAVP